MKRLAEILNQTGLLASVLGLTLSVSVIAPIIPPIDSKPPGMRLES